MLQKLKPEASPHSSCSIVLLILWTGPLSIIGDPLGSALKTTLKPTVGRLTGAVREPSGEASNRVKQVARHEVGYSEEENNKPHEELPGGESIGGKTQDAKNPLGL